LPRLRLATSVYGDDAVPVSPKHAGRTWASAILVAIAMAAPAAGQSTQPVWWPPLSLYGRPVSQPYFDFPNWARYSYCRPAPLAWGYDPFVNYGPCDPGAGFSPHSVACPGDFVAHRPSAWYATADFAPLTVDHLDGFPLASIGPNGPVVLSTEDLRTEFAAGGKFTLGRRIFDCYRLEGTYLGYHTWDDARIVTNADVNALGGLGNLSTFLSGFDTPIAPGLDGANFASAAIRTNFQSGELNLRYWGDMPPGPLDVSLLVGVRYIRIGEFFEFNSQADLPGPGGTTNNLQSAVTNDMWGAQLGIEFSVLVTARWWFDVDLKGGIYNDRVNVETIGAQNGVSDLFTVTRDRTAWVGDIAVIGNWQMTPYCTFRIGYQAIFMNGLSLAQDQLAATMFNNAIGPVADRGKIAYHGPILGLGATW
jgi:hypothetical protein